MSDQLGLVFGALADSTRRQMLDTLMRDGSTSVPALSADLPITRQAVAKHLAALTGAGLVEREPSKGGREVHYRLRPGALDPAATWIHQADQAWAAGWNDSRKASRARKAPRNRQAVDI